MRKIFYSTLLLLFVSNAGCAGFGMKLKNLMKGNGWTDGAGTPQKPFSYNDNPNYKKGEQRKYVRMTKDQFEAEAKLGSGEGSLWLMEGQSSYLFSQNVVRLVGDLLNVKLEGAARTQVETKVNVIKKLLRKLDGPQRRVAAEGEEKGSDKDNKDKDAKDKSDKDSKDKKDGKDATVAKTDEEPKEEESPYGVDQVPTRIIQRTTDGNYRVKGTQSFMIGKREYRVIVSGIVREQDFNDDGISSQVILEPIFDVVSVKRGIL